MTTRHDTDYSRPLRLAAKSASGTEPDLEGRIEGCAVLVTADPDTFRTRTTLRVLIGNLRRLPVRLHLDPRGGTDILGGALVDELEELASGIDPDRPLIIGRPTGAAVHVHVGTSAATALVRGVAEGHGTRLRPHAQSFPALSAPGTGLGAVLTGAFLTAEAFKVIVDVAPGRRGPLRPIDFCPVSLAQPMAGPSSTLPNVQDVALIGAGAIGSAIALILRELGAEGALTVVDPETFDRPNVTTYSLGNHRDAATQIRKVDLVSRELTGFDVTPIKGTAQDFIVGIDEGRYRLPAVVLGAVDSVQARQEIASIHADHTLDGSTGGETGTMLSLAEATWAGPCLRCYYPVPTRTGTTIEQKIAYLTGLSLEQISQGDRLLTASQVQALGDLPAETRRKLNDHIDKPICGLGRALELTGTSNDYNPSAAFVAQQAAALVIGALIRGGTGRPANSVQYDALFGPNEDARLPRLPQPSCRCQNDLDLIREVRQKRLADWH